MPKIEPNFESWILEALQNSEDDGSIVGVAKHIWTHHEAELRGSEDVFFTWQYRMRWAGHKLVKLGKMKIEKVRGKSRWSAI